MYCGKGSAMQLYLYYCIPLDHKYKPESRLTMKALVTLEWGMNVPILTKLQSNLSDFKKQLKSTGTSTKPIRSTRKPHWLDYGDKFSKLYNTGSTSSEVIEFLEQWMKSVKEPTWRNFFKILQYSSSELGLLAYQIKDIFCGN
jgi:hypothetical protein